MQCINSTREAWRDVPGWEGNYQVSNFGSVCSLDRITAHGNRIKGKPKALVLDEHGRPRVFFQSGGKKKTYRVARLVLTAFVGPCPPGMEACHWDDNPENNYLRNLRWDTRSANQIDRIRNGRNQKSNQTECKRGHKFIPENLCPSETKGRKCLACSRAHAYVNRNPTMDLQAVSDSYYAAIIGRN